MKSSLPKLNWDKIGTKSSGTVPESCCLFFPASNKDTEFIHFLPFFFQRVKDNIKCAAPGERMEVVGCSAWPVFASGKGCLAGVGSATQSVTRSDCASGSDGERKKLHRKCSYLEEEPVEL